MYTFFVPNFVLLCLYYNTLSKKVNEKRLYVIGNGKKNDVTKVTSKYIFKFHKRLDLFTGSLIPFFYCLFWCTFIPQHRTTFFAFTPKNTSIRYIHIFIRTVFSINYLFISIIAKYSFSITKWTTFYFWKIVIYIPIIVYISAQCNHLISTIEAWF